MKVRLSGVLALICILLLWSAASVMGDEIKPDDAPMGQTGEASSPSAEPMAPEEPKAIQEPGQSGIRIEDAVVCQNVEDRMPIGSSDVFAKDVAKVYCFCRVIGVAGEGAITHNWYYQGTLKSSVQLPVRSSHWRTWSSKTISPDMAGEWMVEILSTEGAPLGSIIFFVR